MSIHSVSIHTMSMQLCKKCNRFNSLTIFENNCSLCFLETNPQKYMKLYEYMNMGPIYYNYNYYSDEKLSAYTISNSLKNKSKFNILCYCISKINASAFLDTALNILSFENAQGITSCQAAKLLRKYKKSKKFNKLDETGYQNMIGGMIVDWWNINSHDHGYSALCNWSNGKMKPHIKHSIRPAAFKIKKNIHYPYLRISYEESINKLF